MSKRKNHTNCDGCQYEDDPSHYLCRDECVDYSNWTPAINIRVEKYKAIEKLKKNIPADFGIEKKLLDRLGSLMQLVIEYHELETMR